MSVESFLEQMNSLWYGVYGNQTGKYILFSNHQEAA